MTDIKPFQGTSINKSIVSSTIIFLDSDHETGGRHYKVAAAGVRTYLRDVYSDLHGLDIQVRLSHRIPEMPQHEHNYDCGLYIFGFFEAFFKKEPLREKILTQTPIGRTRIFNRKFNGPHLRLTWRCILSECLDATTPINDLLPQLGWSFGMIDRQLLINK